MLGGPPAADAHGHGVGNVVGRVHSGSETSSTSSISGSVQFVLDEAAPRDENANLEAHLGVPHGLDGGWLSTVQPPHKGDISLWRLSWRWLLVASLDGAAFLLVGFLFLGLGEGLMDGDGWILALRSVAWSFIFVLPFHVSANNIAGFLLYGFSSGPSWWAQILVPALTPLRLVRRGKEHGYSTWRAAVACAVWYGVPTALPILLLSVPIGGGAERMGLLIVYAVGGPLVRPVGVVIMTKLIPGLARSRAYFKGMAAASVGYAMTGFYLLLGVWSLFSRLLDFWPNLIMVPVICAYEHFGVTFMERKFTKHFVADAEAARLGLLLTSVERKEESDVAASVLLSLCLNLAARTGWLSYLCQACASTDGVSNLRRVYILARFHMGYPRFAALASLILARLALGHQAFPSRSTSLAMGLLLAQELLEDALAYLAARWGIDAFSHISAPRLHDTAAIPEGDRQSAVVPDGKCAEAWGAAGGAASQDLLQEIYEFKYKPQAPEVLDVLPLWAHLLAVFPAQLHVIMALILGGWGVPYLLGFCNQPPLDTGCLGRGFVWWPPMDPADPCRCQTT